MWTERYTTYYSKDRQWAVRWLERGKPEDQAHVRKFDSKFEAERFYNEMLPAIEAGNCRLELFFSQAKWIQYYGNLDEFGEAMNEPIGESALCVLGDHQECANATAETCTCPCHHVLLSTQM